ncbi:MAG: beta-ketoacyl-[acyl-carrier-protein] synthase family protein [Pseudomonadota bacterium]
MQRVAITGLGVVSPLGNSIDEMFANLVAGRSAIRHLDAPRCSGLRSPVGATVDFNGAACFDVAKLRMLDRVSQFALAAAAQAVADSRIEFRGENPDHCGVSVGCSMGGVQTTDDAYYSLYAERSDRVQPLNIVAAMCNAPASWIGLEYGLSGPNLTYSTACSSSAVAIGEAARRVQSAEADIMIAGGAEAPLTFGILRAWEAMRTLATVDPENPSASCRPFALTRTGLVIGEGAAFVVLEGWDHAVARGATIHAELSGYGLASDIGHITRPSVAGQANAMRVALRSGGIQPGDIDYINAHGTATLANDAVETAAIKEVFGARAYGIPVSSTKSVHAHLLGAAGALEFVISVTALERGITPPTMHLNVRDPACDLDYVADGARSAVLRTVMSNSFAFGGTNAVLIAAAAPRS